MKALSIRQPWAWLIVHGGKDIENRKWNTKYRGRFWVHASKTVDTDAMVKYRDVIPKISDLKFGGIIGSVELVDVVTQSDSKWWIGPKGFVLKNPLPDSFSELPGSLGFFEPEDPNHGVEDYPANDGGCGPIF